MCHSGRFLELEWTKWTEGAVGPTVPLRGEYVDEFEQKLAEHLRAGGGQMDLQPTQELVHGLRGGRPHLRAVLTRAVGAGPGQEAHQDVHQRRVGHHLLRRTLMATEAVVGRCKFKVHWHFVSERESQLSAEAQVN